MARKLFPKVTEPDEGKVHFEASAFSGNVTMCGLTDFLLSKEAGEPTQDPVNCEACLEVVRYVYSFARPQET